MRKLIDRKNSKVAAKILSALFALVFSAVFCLSSMSDRIRSHLVIRRIPGIDRLDLLLRPNDLRLVFRDLGFLPVGRLNTFFQICDILLHLRLRQSGGLQSPDRLYLPGNAASGGL